MVSKMTRRMDAAALAGANCSRSATSRVMLEVVISALSASLPDTFRTWIYRVRGAMTGRADYDKRSVPARQYDV